MLIIPPQGEVSRYNKKYMIMDVTTGQYIKFGKNNKTVGEIEEVIKRVEGYGHKHALIVELSCITPTIL